MANSEGEAIGPNPRTGCDPGHDAVCVLGRRAGRLVGRRAQSGLGRKVALLEAWARPPHPGSHRAPRALVPMEARSAGRPGVGVRERRGQRRGREDATPRSATDPKPPRSRPAPEGALGPRCLLHGVRLLEPADLLDVVHEVPAVHILHHEVQAVLEGQADGGVSIRAFPGLCAVGAVTRPPPGPRLPGAEPGR